MTATNIALALRRWVSDANLTSVATEIGTSKESIARFAAGMPVRKGTRALIEQAVLAHSAHVADAKR